MNKSESKYFRYSEQKRNVNRKIWKTWKDGYTHGDLKKLIEFTGASQPVITYAIKNGYVSNPDLIEKISQYFREKKETDAMGIKHSSVVTAMVGAIEGALPGTTVKAMAQKAEKAGDDIVNQIKR